MSGTNRNVLILGPVEMSAVRGVSPLLLEGSAPGVILGWTPRPLAGTLRLAVGRIGLRRSATRAPAGRLYARGRRRRTTVPALFFPPGVGRLSVKLRGSGGRAPRAGPRRDLLVVQVALPEADRHRPVWTQLNHHLSLP